MAREEEEGVNTTDELEAVRVLDSTGVFEETGELDGAGLLE